MFKINKSLLVYTFLVIINLLVVLFYMNKRDGMHVDEQLSYAHANSSVGAFMFEGADHSFKLVDGVTNRWVDTKLYKDYFTVNENNRFSYKGIVEKLSFDVHPPLYYIILHTLSSIYYGSFSKWLGLSINIVLFILISIGIFKLSKLFFKDEKYAILPMMLWGFSDIGISTMLFIRMYALQTFLLTMLIFETAKIIKENDANYYRLILIFIYSALGILTQYNSIFFSVFLAGISSFVLMKNKQYSILLKYDIVILLSILSLFVVFPPAYDVLLNSQRGTGCVDNLIINIKYPLDIDFYRFIKIYTIDFLNLKSAVNFHLISFIVITFYLFNLRNETLERKIKFLYIGLYIFTLLLSYLLPIGALFLLYLFNLCKRFFISCLEQKQMDTLLFWSLCFIISSSLFIFIIMPRMGDYETRYIMPLMPFIAVVTIYVSCKIGSNLKLNKKYLYLILLSLVALNSYETKFGKYSVFKMQNTLETNNFIKNVSGKDVFVVQYRGELLYFIERGHYLQNANRVYLETELTDANLIKEIEKNNDIDILILNQNALDNFWGRPYFFDLNPNMKNILSFVSDIVISERRYKLYNIKK